MVGGGPLIVAGAPDNEQLPTRRDPSDPRWFEPPHVRDPRIVRERIAGQVAAGADVVIAPTWRTHRRALLPVGESRRATEWTRAAVRIAREGAESGLERRDGADAPVGGRVLVWGSLPALDEVPESESGRLLPHEAASERDYRTQAGILADAVVDGTLVEGQPGLAEARLALGSAADTGVPVIALAGLTSTVEGRPRLPDGSDLEAWLELATQARAAAFLAATTDAVEAPTGAILARLLAAGAEIRGRPTTWGVLHRGGASSEELASWARGWLGAGARIVGLQASADPGAIVALRGVRDESEAATAEARIAARARIARFIADAASWAPGGEALWIGERSGGIALPSGFTWTEVSEAEVPRLPEGRYRLVLSVDPGLGGDAADGVGPGRLARVLDDGGILAVRVPSSAGGGHGIVAGPAEHAGLRRVAQHDDASDTLVAWRRDPR